MSELSSVWDLVNELDQAAEKQRYGSEPKRAADFLLHKKRSKMADKIKFTSEEIPKGWNGKDWQAYKFAMLQGDNAY
ncbi:hypothetical protein PInf_005464 [Phytophthora infestans]|nr:hypothetical protein PInf_005464 [Phytophthora infestans]